MVGQSEVFKCEIEWVFELMQRRSSEKCKMQNARARLRADVIVYV